MCRSIGGDCKFQLWENQHVPLRWHVHLLSRSLRSGGWLFYESTHPRRPWWRPGDSSPWDAQPDMQVRLRCGGGGEYLHAETKLFVSVELMQCKSCLFTSVLSHFIVKMWASSGYSSFLPWTTNKFMALFQWRLGWTPAHLSTWWRINNTNQIETVKKKKA